MFYFLKPLPEKKIDFTTYKPFITNKWFDKHFMKFVYVLQVMLVLLSVRFGVWNFFSWFVNVLLFCGVYLVHELLHILVIFRIGDISLTHSGIFFWIHSDAVMSKKRFLSFMTLPLFVLTIVPILIMPWASGYALQFSEFIAWINAIIACADIINGVLIAIKPAKSEFYRGYYR